MFINNGNCFWGQMNVEAFINMAFSANVQIDDPAEQGISENAAPGNPRQHEALHVGLPHILGQVLLSSRQLSVVFGCTPCP
jgi:hypothetical protein